MRKIENDMVRAVEARKNWAVSNTAVVVDKDNGTITVKLHGNPIYIHTITGKHYVTCAGWNSNTTRSRLRALGFYVVSKDFTPHLNGAPVDSDSWYVFRHKGDKPSYIESRDVPY